MDSKDLQNRIEEAYKLLTQPTTNRVKFESIRTLIKGVNPKIDEALKNVSRALSDFSKLEKGKVIELTAEYLPENTEEEKKRKKRILILISHWKNLTSEVERIKKDLSQNPEKPLKNTVKIIKYAKGPFGIITIFAVLVVAGFSFLNIQKTPEQTSRPIDKELTGRKTQVIIVEGKKIPLSEVHSVAGPECEGKPHYHANINFTAAATDGTEVQETDPSGCGYGKVEDIKVETVNLP
jgi:hypothetical protein